MSDEGLAPLQLWAGPECTIARIGKNLKLNKCDINFDLDIFNLLNLAPVLGRQYDLRVTTANQALEIMNPRIIRFGVRISY